MSRIHLDGRAPRKWLLVSPRNEENGRNVDSGIAQWHALPLASIHEAHAMAGHPRDRGRAFVAPGIEDMRAGSGGQATMVTR